MLLPSCHKPLDRIRPLEPQIRAYINRCKVEQNKSNEDPYIPPPMCVLDGEPHSILISRFVLAEVADPSNTSLHVATCLLDVRHGVRLTSLTGWRMEAGELPVSTADWLIVNDDS